MTTLPTRKRKVVYIGKAGNPCTIQDLYLQECLLGVKLAVECKSFDELRARLADQLPQGSPETRDLYALRIRTWLCPNGSLDSAPVAVWRAYRDEQIALDHFRVRYLEAVPLLGKFVTGPLASVEVGETLGGEAVRAFVSRECGQPIPKTVERIPRNLSKLGFLARVDKGYVRTIPTYDPTSVLLELHRFFGQSPATTAFAEVVAHPFWRYLGVPDAATLEHILYTAVRHGILPKFVKSDELNQITTGYAYSELLARRLRIPISE